MECMKCGRETQKNNVFCADCLAEMEKYPVKQDTPVVLPQRQQKERKNNQKKSTKPEDIIAQLQKRVRQLWIAVLILAVLLLAAGSALAVNLYRHSTPDDLGSNYSTFTSTE